ncbi:MatE family [Coleofasciculus chthonoplastes PCC 7420]|uniref:MatE family n=1 Tax=Coleofasciculus chthonoplastes PCC 7420 TaxID=118168 RepID=B4VZZ3_9CYAN|nr:flippase [Coleofasciculus chthonoplastes]EDX72473.1 MatE family [Coleofasciculus chthonoplastes PCC 7420]
MTNQLSITRLLKRGVIESFFLRALGAVLLFLMHSLVARLIGSKNYGTFSYALIIVNILSVVVSLGWPTALVRFIVQYQEKQQWSLLHGIVLRASQMTMFFSILVSLVLWVISYTQSIPNNIILSCRFAALLLPLFALVNLRKKVFQALRRIKTSIILEELILPLTILTGLSMLPMNTTTDILLLYFGAAFLACLLSTVLLWWCFPVQGKTALPTFKLAMDSGTLPMMLGGISQIVMNRADIFMLGFLIDMEAVGVYNAANRIASLNIFVLQAVNIIAAPMLAAAFHSSRLDEFKAIMRRAMLCSTIGSLPLFIIIIIRAKHLLIFFGSEFTQGSLLLKIMACGQLFNAVSGPVGFALLMVGKERIFAFLTSIIALANVVGNLFAIPMYGTLGAALVTTGCIIMLNGLMFYLTQGIKVSVS